MTAEENKRELTNILRAQMTNSDALLQSIVNEQEALASQNIDALETITNTKFELTEKIELAELERVLHIEALGFTNDAKGMEDCLSTMDDSKSLVKVWHQILDNIRACRDTNLTNGAVLEFGRRQAENALNILRQHHAPNETYGSGGQKAAAFGNRELGKA